MTAEVSGVDEISVCVIVLINISIGSLSSSRSIMLRLGVAWRFSESHWRSGCEGYERRSSRVRGVDATKSVIWTGMGAILDGIR